MTRQERITFVIDCFMQAYGFCFVNKNSHVGAVSECINLGDCGMLALNVSRTSKRYGINLTIVSTSSHVFLYDPVSSQYYDSFFTEGCDECDINEYPDGIKVEDAGLSGWSDSLSDWEYKFKIVRPFFEKRLRGVSLDVVALSDDLRHTPYEFAMDQRRIGNMAHVHSPDNIDDDYVKVGHLLTNHLTLRMSKAIPQLVQSFIYQYKRRLSADGSLELAVCSPNKRRLVTVVLSHAGTPCVAIQTKPQRVSGFDKLSQEPFFIYLLSLQAQLKTTLSNIGECTYSSHSLLDTGLHHAKSGLYVQFKIHLNECIKYQTYAKPDNYSRVVSLINA